LFLCYNILAIRYCFSSLDNVNFRENASELEKSNNNVGQIKFYGEIMANYKNEALNKIKEKFGNIDLSEIDEVFVVPVGEICDKLGLSADFRKLGSGHSGYLDFENKTIVVNDDYPASRNLFTIAHEIGHYILHNSSQNRFDQYRKYTPKELREEKEANDFAGELLMPKYKFEEVFNELRGDVKKIAERFGVSQKAVEVRGFCLGLIDNI
jgi:Zn-dependent peptidase ImmA (M78 family)